MLGFLEWNRGGRIVLMGFDVIWMDEGGVAREEGKKREPQIEDIIKDNSTQRRRTKG
jgi:hypothetical protein